MKVTEIIKCFKIHKRKDYIVEELIDIVQEKNNLTDTTQCVIYDMKGTKNKPYMIVFKGSLAELKYNLTTDFVYGYGDKKVLILEIKGGILRPAHVEITIDTSNEICKAVSKDYECPHKTSDGLCTVSSKEDVSMHCDIFRK